MSSAHDSPIAILGMHRSGTSCLAGCLEEAGLYLGAVNTKAPANARGNRENRAIMNLHDDVLDSHGFSWDKSPPLDRHLKWTQEQTERQHQLIGGYSIAGQHTWGFKDPRSLLLLEQWFESLPGLRLVASIRHPASVAASLRRRNGFSWEQGYLLWLHYNQRLQNCLSDRDFPLINFDQSPASYQLAMAKVVSDLGLQTPIRGFAFFSGELRNAQPSEHPQLPDEVAQLYASLLEKAI